MMLRLTMAMTVSGLFLCAGQAMAEPVQWEIADGGNGHFYDYVDGRIRWSEAKAAAEASLFGGVPGYLVTITSEAEKEFLRNHVPKPGYRAWLGGFQDTTAPDYAEPGGGWRWITGEPWDYTHWASPEPNNWQGREEYLEMDRAANSPDNFGWSDQGDYESTNSGYYVEYAAVPEPSTLVLLGMGVVGWLACVRRRRIGATLVGRPMVSLRAKRGILHGTGALGERHQPVDTRFIEHFDTAADPADFDSVDLPVLAEAEVQPRAVMALVSAAAMDLVDLRQVAGNDFHPGPDAVTVGPCAAQTDFSPVVAVGGIISQHGRVAQRDLCGRFRRGQAAYQRCADQRCTEDRCASPCRRDRWTRGRFADHAIPPFRATRTTGSPAGWRGRVQRPVARPPEHRPGCRRGREPYRAPSS